MRTVVVLPLRDQSAFSDVARALDRLVEAGENEPAQAEMAVLFLQGVSKVIVIDHVRDRRWVFGRVISGAHDGVAEATVAVEGPQGAARTRRFWVLQRDALHAAYSARS